MKSHIFWCVIDYTKMVIDYQWLISKNKLPKVTILKVTCFWRVSKESQLLKWIVFKRVAIFKQWLVLKKLPRVTNFNLSHQMIINMWPWQLISDIIYCLQGLRPQDTQWTRRSSTGPWGFQLWLRASVSPTGCPFPPARSCHRDIGKYAHGSIDFWCHLLFAGIVPTRRPVDPKKSNGALGFPALVAGLCSPTGYSFPPCR